MGEMVRYGILPNPHTPGILVDFYGNPISGGGVIPGGGDGMPIADPAGITTATQTPDPISNAHSALWVKFPVDQMAMAYGLAGDSYPRVAFPADPRGYGFVYLGNGTYDPTQNSNFIDLENDAQRGDYMRVASNGLGVGAVLGELLAYGSVGTSNPNGIVPGLVGDIIAAKSQNAGYPCWWRCTTFGNASTAVWMLESVIAPTDPITAAYTPPNAGAIWQDTSGSGSVWVSTGTSPGDWSQLVGSDSGWIDLSTDLANSWAPFTSLPTAGGACRYRNLNGIVTVQLSISGGSNGGILTTPLPAGFRPAADLSFVVLVENGGVLSAGMLNVGTTGGVAVDNFAVTVPDSLNGASISFPADA